MKNYSEWTLQLQDVSPNDSANIAGKRNLSKEYENQSRRLADNSRDNMDAAAQASPADIADAFESPASDARPRNGSIESRVCSKIFRAKIEII